MPIGNGGIIGPANVPTLASAKGVWSLREAQLAQRQGIWPLGLIPDPYFEYTTLLLPGNGTNGAQNNTFLDSSTNNFTITRNGNTTQGTFSPLSQTGWGNYFTGSGRLALGINSAFDITQGNFTVEAWVNISAYTNFQHIAHYRWDTPSSSGWIFRINATTGYLQFSYIGGSSVISTSSVPLNSWVHVAACRSGGTCYLFINGTPVGSASFSNGTTNNTIGLRIGAYYDGTENLIGYMSNFRLVKNGALYTSSFTPSTTPLTTSVSSGTVSLLICQSNRFIDNSSNAFAITQEGSTTSVVAFSPFNPTAQYIPSINGGSGYFDGNGDFLSLPTNTATALGSGNFTAEAWVYPDGTPAGTGQIIGSWDGSTTLSWTLAVNTNASITFAYTTSGVYGHSTSFSSSANAVIVNAWNHVAAVRTSGTIIVYINGIVVINQSIAGTLYSAPNNTKVGSNNQPQPFKGYLVDVRLVVGTAVYSGTSTTTPNFTLPTAPLTNITNTSLLLNFTNAGIYDATSKNDLETVGNARISTAISAKWGSGSMYFDGTGDYLIAPNNTLCQFLTGDYTIECWVYLNATKEVGIFDTRNAAGSASGVAIALDSSNFPFVFVNNAKLFTSSTAISTGVWTHLAVSKVSNVITLYINGTKPTTGSGTSTTSMTDSTITVASVIDYRDATATYKLNGYLQDLRITKGYARYTANFTPPTAAFPTL